MNDINYFIHKHIISKFFPREIVKTTNGNYLYQSQTGLKNIIKYDYWFLWQEDLGIDFPIIQIQNNYSEKPSIYSYFALTIDDDPKIVFGKSKIKEEDFLKAKRFIINNKEILLKLSADEHSGFHEDYMEDYLENMIR